MRINTYTQLFAHFFKWKIIIICKLVFVTHISIKLNDLLQNWYDRKYFSIHYIHTYMWCDMAVDLIECQHITKYILDIIKKCMHIWPTCDDKYYNWTVYLMQNECCWPNKNNFLLLCILVYVLRIPKCMLDLIKIGIY